MSRKYNLKLLMTRDQEPQLFHPLKKLRQTMIPREIHLQRYILVFYFVFFYNQSIPNQNHTNSKMILTFVGDLETKRDHDPSRIEFKHTPCPRLRFPIQFITCTILLTDMNHMHTFKKNILFEEKYL